MKVKTNSGDSIDLEFSDMFFETFKGSPDELKELMEMIINQVKDGSLFEESQPVDVENLTEDEIQTFVNNSKRTLQ